MYGEAVSGDARVERLIPEIEFETELVTVVGNRSVKVIHQKLRGYTSKVRSHGGSIMLRLDQR